MYSEAEFFRHVLPLSVISQDTAQFLELKATGTISWYNDGSEEVILEKRSIKEEFRFTVISTLGDLALRDDDTKMVRKLSIKGVDPDILPKLKTGVRGENKYKFLFIPYKKVCYI